MSIRVSVPVDSMPDVWYKIINQYALVTTGFLEILSPVAVAWNVSFLITYVIRY